MRFGSLFALEGPKKLHGRPACCRCYWLTSATVRIQATSARHWVDHHHTNRLSIALSKGKATCGTVLFLNFFASPTPAALL